MINFSMLLINNNRSKAYLQNLIKNNFIPKKVILLNDKNVTLVEHTENDKLMAKETSQKFVRHLADLNISFDEKEHILRTIENNNIEYCLVDNLDINSKEVIEKVKEIDDEYIVYSGPGGTILRTEILSLGKKFIHVHPGWLPKFRGSTTIYYSMLLESKVGCSVILFEEGIDEGPILYQQEYKINEKEIDFDYVLDPLVRAKALVEFFKTDSIKPISQDYSDDASTFYIIHPLLKHISIINHNK
ncbi:MAG: formyltransferase family protein [Salinivirgaceae bacterium]|jgi:methionyl-tRNA formyltransferase|nr:formyltransferase family protein [Salinivirgaceae bacterium]